ncbi:MAG TPA: S8 family serine peptidase, partial [Candidatus Binatia bacterium]|nr:S8 family serine peptidase [Candidatus Binatia bacterium]
AAGAQVVVDDLVFTDERKFEDGPVAAAARAFVAGGGVYVTAAGNFATSHYFATYAPGKARTFGGAAYAAVHQFALGDFGDSFRIPPGGSVLAVLQWNDAFGAAADDFDLILAQNGTNAVLVSSTETQAGHGNPFEAVSYTNVSGVPLDVYLAIAEAARTTPAAKLRLNLVVFSRAALGQDYVVARDAIFGHAAVEEVLSVAAADATTPTIIEPFSSGGPASIFFPTPVVRQVPRLTAVDGVATAVGGRGQFANPFRGTSAAAPHVAGCAALLVAAGIAPAAASSAIQATAVDVAPAGFDSRSGAGLVDCGTAARVATGQVAPPLVGSVSARFDPTAAVVVDVSGDDADGDARSFAVRFLDAGGGELARETAPVTAAGAAFTGTVATRNADLATARAVGVRATDALRLAGAETAAPIACPGDDSVGDVFCRLGDLLDALGAVPGRRGRAVLRAGRAAAAALVRAGAATASARPRRARGPLGVASGRLNAVRRLARRAAVPDALRQALVGDAQALRGRIRALRAAL